MELFPILKIGWLNGWLGLVLLGLTEGTLFLAFPRAVVKRLFDRSGWSQKQQVFTIAGKLCALVCLALLIIKERMVSLLHIARLNCWSR